MTRKTPSSVAIDRQVGHQIRFYRLQHGWSQQELAVKIGVSYQQLHKYENGSNSISAGRLADAARVLRVSPASFFAGLDEATQERTLPVGDREQILLSKYFNEIRDPRQRELLQVFVRGLAEACQ